MVGAGGVCQQREREKREERKEKERRPEFSLLLACLKRAKDFL
jgi:hypothetical protein